MQLTPLKLLGLPVLEAQAKVHTALLDNIYKILRTKRLAARLGISVITDQDEDCSSTFHFPLPEAIPPELITFLENYAARLVQERWAINEAIEELKAEMSWYSLSKFVMN